jgi:CRISPR-associated protein Cas1
LVFSSVKNRSKSHFLISNGELLVKDSSLIFRDSKNSQKRIPAEAIEELYILSPEVNWNSRVLNFLSSKNITMHLFLRNRLQGTFQPFSKEGTKKSSKTFVEQVKILGNGRKRLFLAKSFTAGSIHNSGNNCKRYGFYFDKKRYLESLKNANSVNELMGFEGTFKRNYFKCWNSIIRNLEDFKFFERSRRPPKDRINSMISYLNTRIYTTTLHEIFKTKLDPRVGYLHESNDRDFTLHLDISEIFKPIIADNLIFQLINSGQITKNDFAEGVRFTKSGIKKVEIEFAKKLSETFENINWRDRIRIEANRIRDYIENGETYKPFIF